MSNSAGMRRTARLRDRRSADSTLQPRARLMSDMVAWSSASAPTITVAPAPALRANGLATLHSAAIT